MARKAAFLLAAALLVTEGGCYRLRPSHSGGQARFSGQRPIRPEDIAVPAGYVVDVVAKGLTFPSDVLFDDLGRVYIVESGYAPGETWATPKLLRVEPDDAFTVMAEGGKNGPWTGATYADGQFYIAEGGELEGGKILRLDPQDPNRRLRVVLDGLPGTGDYHTSAPRLGPDGLLYFGQGTMTNAGVVGDDNDQLGWLERYPAAHDIPCADLRLGGFNFPTKKGKTGAFMPYGVASQRKQVVLAGALCNGAIYRMPLSGGKPQLVAWGLRDPFGLAFSPQGDLFATDAGYEPRGARQVWGAPDFLWRVSSGTWYGWPDYSGPRPVSDPDFQPPGRLRPGLLLQSSPPPPPKPAAVLASQAGSAGLDFSRSESFGHLDEAFIAQFGDRGTLSGKLMRPVGFKVVRVNLATGDIEDFAVNKGHLAGPASLLGSGGLERPIAVKFSPSGSALYVVDFGVVTFNKDGAEAAPGTGVVWRIKRRD